MCGNLRHMGRNVETRRPSANLSDAFCLLRVQHRAEDNRFHRLILQINSDSRKAPVESVALVIFKTHILTIN